MSDLVRRLPTWAMVLAAVVVPAVTGAGLTQLRGVLDGTNAALVLVLVVVAAGATGYRRVGAVAAISSALAFDFFLTEPYYELVIADPADVETAVLLCAVGLLAAEIAVWGHRQAARANRRAGYLAGVVHAARLAADGRSPAEVVVEQVGAQIEEVLGVSRCTFVPGAPGSHPRLERDGQVRWNGASVDVDRGGMPTLDVVEIAVAARGTTYGRYVLTAADRVARPDLEQRLTAVTLADQACVALRSAAQTRTPRSRSRRDAAR